MMVIVAFLALTIAASAQDRAAWFKGLQDARGRSCCDISDCAAAASRYVDGGWQAEFRGAYVPVPPAKILETESIDGRAYLCAQPGIAGPTVYCFVKPGGGF